jgi:uncharacterized protein (DUF2384 family)
MKADILEIGPILADEIAKEVSNMSSMETSQTPTKEFVNNHAREIFGEPRKAYSWMNTPNAILNGMRPKDFIEHSTPEDLQLVIDELDRIDQGLF